MLLAPSRPSLQMPPRQMCKQLMGRRVAAHPAAAAALGGCCGMQLDQGRNCEDRTAQGKYECMQVHVRGPGQRIYICTRMYWDEECRSINGCSIANLVVLVRNGIHWFVGHTLNRYSMDTVDMGICSIRADVMDVYQYASEIMKQHDEAT